MAESDKSINLLHGDAARHFLKGMASVLRLRPRTLPRVEVPDGYPKTADEALSGDWRAIGGDYGTSIESIAHAEVRAILNAEVAKLPRAQREIIKMYLAGCPKRPDSNKPAGVVRTRLGTQRSLPTPNKGA